MDLVVGEYLLAGLFGVVLVAGVIYSGSRRRLKADPLVVEAEIADS